VYRNSLSPRILAARKPQYFGRHELDDLPNSANCHTNFELDPSPMPFESAYCRHKDRKTPGPNGAGGGRSPEVSSGYEHGSRTQGCPPVIWLSKGSTREFRGPKVRSRKEK